MLFELSDEEATVNLGAQLAEVAQPGDVIFLHGELGAGKTALSRGFLRHFFANPSLEVPSPSYLICFTYGDAAADATPEVPTSSSANGHGSRRRTAGRPRLPGVNVLHLDPYRLPEGKVASLIDLAPAFARHICLIEWPERLGAQLVSSTTPPRLELTLGGIGPQAAGRAVSLRAVGERWSTQLDAWASAGRVDVVLPAPPPAPLPAEAGSTSAANEGEEALPAPWEAMQPAAAHTGVAVASAAASASVHSSQFTVRPAGDPRSWLVLGIESSCDDTGAAVVRGDGTVLGEVLASQAGVHEVWGGVVPSLAQEAHRKAIDATVDEALRRAGISAAELSAVAVTVGPGLSLCLEVGVRKAIALTTAHQLPLVRCHHMEAHAMVTWLPSTPPPLLPPPRPPPPPEAPDAPAAAPATAAAAAAASHDSTWAEKKTKFVPTKSSRAAAIPALHLPPELPAAAADGGAASSTPANDAPHGATAPTASTQLSPDGVPPFPFLTLLVSGGHNLLVLTTALGAHAILGSTLDDSIGEAFDKTARLLGIPQIPGGPVLERLAREGDPRRHALPAPLSKTKDAELRASCDFSYAGLKSAVRQLLETRLPPTRRSELPAAELQRELADVAASFQRVAVEHLAQRTARALEWALETAPNLTCLVVAGGVAANLLVRSELARVASEAGLPMVCPPLRLCMDNGLMVAWTGVQRLRLGLAERPLRADADDETQRLFVEVRPKWPLGPRDPRSKTLQQQLSKRKQPHNQPNQPAQTAPVETLEEPLVAEDVNADGQASMTKPNGQASKRPRAEAEVES